MLALDANTTSQTAGLVTSRTFSHTCTSQPSRALFVIAIMKAGSNPSSFTATYAGVSMTKIGEAASLSDGVTVAAFYLVNPAAGANNVVVSWTTSAGGQIVARSYTGVHQGVPVLPGSYTSDTFGAVTGPSITVSSRPGDIVMDGIGFGYNTSSTAAAGAGQTEVMDIEANSVHTGASVEAGAASVTMSWTITNPRNGVMVGFSIHLAPQGIGPAISPAMFF